MKTIELQVRSKDNRPVWLEGHCIPFFDTNKRLLALEGIVRDISERKNGEKEMSKLNQLHILGETAATIAHEIRNPMTTASGFLQILRGKAELSSYQSWFNLVIEEINKANHCYQIAAKHGAKITVKTGSGGTTFIVKFKKLTQPHE